MSIMTNKQFEKIFENCLNKQEWYHFCSTEDIPIELLRQYRQYVDWGVICMNRNYNLNDVNFVRQFKQNMNWTSLMNRTDVSDRRKEQYKKEFNLVKVVGVNWFGREKVMWYELVGSKR